MSSGQVLVAPWDDRRNRVPADLSSKVRYEKDTSSVATLPSEYPFKRVMHKVQGRLRREDEPEKVKYDISWHIYSSSNPPDNRLAQEGNIWIEERSDGGTIHLCLRRGIWSSWAGNFGRRYIQHPYVPALIFLFTGKKWRWGAKNSLGSLRSNWLNFIPESQHDNIRKAIWGAEVVEDWESKLHLEDFAPAQTIRIWRCQPTQPPLLVPGKGSNKTPPQSLRDDAPIPVPLYDTSGRRLPERPDDTTESKDRQPSEAGSSPTPASAGSQRKVKKPRMGRPSSSGDTQTARPRSSTLPGARPQKAPLNSDEEPSTRPKTGAPPQKRPRTNTVDVMTTTETKRDSSSASQTQRVPARPPLADHERGSTLPSKRPAPREASPEGPTTLSKTERPPSEKRARFARPPASSQTQAAGAPEGPSPTFRGDPHLLFTPPESPTNTTSASAEPPSPLTDGKSGRSSLPKESGAGGAHAGTEQPAQPPASSLRVGGDNSSIQWSLLQSLTSRADRNETENATLKKQVEVLERERDALTQKLYAASTDPTTSPAYRKLLDAYQKLEASQKERLESERKRWDEENGASCRRLAEEVKVLEQREQKLRQTQCAAADYIVKLQSLSSNPSVDPPQPSLTDSAATRRGTWSTSNESDRDNEGLRSSPQLVASTSRLTDSDGPTRGGVSQIVQNKPIGSHNHHQETSTFEAEVKKLFREDGRAEGRFVCTRCLNLVQNNPDGDWPNIFEQVTFVDFESHCMEKHRKIYRPL